MALQLLRGGSLFLLYLPFLRYYSGEWKWDAGLCGCVLGGGFLACVPLGPAVVGTGGGAGRCDLRMLLICALYAVSWVFALGADIGYR